MEVIELSDPSAQAVGAFIYSLIDKANPITAGTTARQAAKPTLHRVGDPDELGEFRIQITEENANELMDAIFAPRGGY
jgi:hypothetical protein